MLVTLASITLNWRSGLLLIAAIIFAIVFFLSGSGTPRTWNLPALASCLACVAWCLWAAGVN